MARGSTIDRDSVEYVKIPVTPPLGVTISAQVVQIAIVPENGHPIETDWQTADWVSTNVARVLMGTGTLALTPGTYKAWVKVTDNPEVPVLLAGTITVT